MLGFSGRMFLYSDVANYPDEQHAVNIDEELFEQSRFLQHRFCSLPGTRSRECASAED